MRFRRMILSRDGYRCQRCGGRRKLRVHHILERHRRPDLKYEPSNCQVLCEPCHIEHHRPAIAPDRAEWHSYMEANPL